MSVLVLFGGVIIGFLVCFALIAWVVSRALSGYRIPRSDAPVLIKLGTEFRNPGAALLYGMVLHHADPEWCHKAMAEFFTVAKMKPPEEEDLADTFKRYPL